MWKHASVRWTSTTAESGSVRLFRGMGPPAEATVYGVREREVWMGNMDGGIRIR